MDLTLVVGLAWTVALVVGSFHAGRLVGLAEGRRAKAEEMRQGARLLHAERNLKAARGAEKHDAAKVADVLTDPEREAAPREIMEATHE